MIPPLGKESRKSCRTDEARNWRGGLMVLPAMPTGRANARPMTGSASSGDGSAAKSTQAA